MQATAIKQKTDEYISFEKTNYKNPYTDPVLLAMEDIFGFMLTYKRPFDEGDIGYLIRKKKGLHTHKCMGCYRLPENRKDQPSYKQGTKVQKLFNVEESKRTGMANYDIKVTPIPLKCDDCRVLKLKQSMNAQIKKSRFLLGHDDGCMIQRIVESMS